METISITVKPHIRHIHGVNIDDCAICDREINESNPGKAVEFEQRGQKFVQHTCNNCSEEPEFKEWIITNKATIKEYKY